MTNIEFFKLKIIYKKISKSNDDKLLEKIRYVIDGNKVYMDSKEKKIAGKVIDLFEHLK